MEHPYFYPFRWEQMPVLQSVHIPEVFFMFSGEKVLVDLRCDNSLMKTMVDRFGEDVTTLAYDMTSFRVLVLCQAKVQIKCNQFSLFM